MTSAELGRHRAGSETRRELMSAIAAANTLFDDPDADVHFEPTDRQDAAAAVSTFDERFATLPGVVTKALREAEAGTELPSQDLTYAGEFEIAHGQPYLWERARRVVGSDAAGRDVPSRAGRLSHCSGQLHTPARPRVGLRRVRIDRLGQPGPVAEFPVAR